MYAGVIRFIFLIGPLFLIGVWSGEDQRPNKIKTMFKRDWRTSLDFIDYSTPNNEHN